MSWDAYEVPTWMIVRCFCCGRIWCMGRTICINCEGRKTIIKETQK